MIQVPITPANVQDSHGAVPLLKSVARRFRALRLAFADRAYRVSKLLNAIADPSGSATSSRNRADGSSNEPSHGSVEIDASAKTMRLPSQARKPRSTSLPSNSSHAKSQDHDLRVRLSGNDGRSPSVFANQSQILHPGRMESRSMQHVHLDAHLPGILVAECA